MIYTITFNPALDISGAVEQLVPDEKNYVTTNSVLLVGMGFPIRAFIHNSSRFKKESMKVLFLLFWCLSISTSAEVLRIESIDQGMNSAEADHVYFSDGRVGIVPEEKYIDYANLLREGMYVDISLDKNHRIIHLSPAPKPSLKKDQNKKRIEEYAPTVLQNLAEVDTIFKRMKCYNRAHVWNYEEFKKTGLKSKKVFIFFTRRYIRDYNFYWWFHAIPTVLANSQGNVVERYLDPRYAHSPLTSKSWTDIFVRSRRDCPVITRYSEYRDNQESQHCYLHFSSMFYWQPRDLEKFERTGFEKESFIQSEVNHAYKEAF